MCYGQVGAERADQLNFKLHKEAPMNENNFLKGLVIGGFLGLAAGLLFAPKSGKETRADICNRTEELLKAANEEYEKGLKKTSQLYDSVKAQAGKFKADVSEFTESGKQKIEETSNRFKQAVDAGVEAFHEPKNNKGDCYAGRIESYLIPYFLVLTVFASYFLAGQKNSKGG